MRTQLLEGELSTREARTALVALLRRMQSGGCAKRGNTVPVSMGPGSRNSTREKAPRGDMCAALPSPGRSFRGALRSNEH